MYARMGLQWALMARTVPPIKNRSTRGGQLKLQSAYVRDYMAILTGAVGRLVIALAYFLVAANTLSLADFGRFATASGIGLIIARLGALGFISAVFRTGTVKPRLLGAYMAGFLALFAASAPLILGLAWLVHALLFSSEIPWTAFALIVGAEALCWRLVEFVSTANNGVRAYGKAAIVVILGTLIRTLIALAYWLSGSTDLTLWAASYALGNAVAAVAALMFFRPPGRLRLRWKLYPRWARESLASMAADMVFYVQSELDKVVILTMASPQAAGLYAIAMRLIDLTATPVRSFNQIIMQRIMRERAMIAGLGKRALAEGAIIAMSLAGFAGIVVLLHVFPNALGRNVAKALPVLMLMALVPVFRNLVEYHAELLYARQRTALRAVLLALLAVVKAGLLALAITLFAESDSWLSWTNGIFAVLYLISAAVCYSALRQRQNQAGPASR
jgi:O-antigen/teichoic acid export membrane protein